MVISLRSGKTVDTHVGKRNENDSSSPTSFLLSSQSDDVIPSPMVPILSKEADEPKESKSIYDSTSPRDSPTFSPSVSKPSPPFPN